ncbi:MAG TPA: hypothetical protein VFU36_10090 [Jatrophihabitans sp.]|nr:hypothetical protein [Jatrophihabitans sp.]
MPTSQVSFLREAGKPGYDRSRPIFQATIPTGPPGATPSYTPVSAVINVDLLPNILATNIKKDSDLFMRSTTGDIIAADTTKVAQFTVTGELVDLQIQFADGAQ